MARVKKATPAYEIDLSFPNRTREFLFNDDGTEKYTVMQLLDMAARGGGQYSKEFVPDVKERYLRDSFISSNQKWTLENLAADWSPEWDAFNDKFFVWYDSRPDMIDMYQHCAKSQWWFYDRDGAHHSREDAEKLGWVDRPLNWRMFQSIANGWEASKYRELHREVIYDVGDQVMLREPFKGSYRYDPCYGKGLATNDDRIGMVVEHKDEINNRSRGGKGSRMINVLWITTGEQKAVPERIIKKYREKKVA